MKLSELVAYRNALDKFKVSDIQLDSARQLSIILHEVESNQLQIANSTNTLKEDSNNITQAFTHFGNTLEEIKRQLSELIETHEKAYFAESYRMYDEEMCHETAQWILNRKMPISPTARSLIDTRIRSYSDWKYPGMVIRPALENFIQDMVSFDPLYIVDREHDLLAPALENFPIEYQRRLRPYYISESFDNEILGKIPDEQFGFCLAYNFFEFKPFEILKKYLTEIYTKLRPGGILAMTFNDCDRAHCVALVEAHFTCYTPGSMVRNLAETIGYEQVFNWHDNGNLTWLELKKPGKLSSIRGGQTLAKVMPK